MISAPNTALIIKKHKSTFQFLVLTMLSLKKQVKKFERGAGLVFPEWGLHRRLIAKRAPCAD